MVAIVPVAICLWMDFLIPSAFFGISMAFSASSNTDAALIFCSLLVVALTLTVDPNPKVVVDDDDDDGLLRGGGGVVVPRKKAEEKIGIGGGGVKAWWANIIVLPPV